MKPNLILTKRMTIFKIIALVRLFPKVGHFEVSSLPCFGDVKKTSARLFSESPPRKKKHVSKVEPSSKAFSSNCFHTQNEIRFAVVFTRITKLDLRLTRGILSFHSHFRVLSLLLCAWIAASKLYCKCLIGNDCACTE